MRAVSTARRDRQRTDDVEERCRVEAVKPSLTQSWSVYGVNSVHCVIRAV